MGLGPGRTYQIKSYWRNLSRRNCSYATDRAAVSTSRSFSAASFFQCLAIRSKNFRSSALLAFEAYHSHWRAFSAHSAIVIAAPLGLPKSHTKMLIEECLCDGDHKIVWGRFEHALRLSSTLARANELGDQEVWVSAGSGNFFFVQASHKGRQVLCDLSSVFHVRTSPEGPQRTP
jgi:hypothetical protein